MSCIIIVVMIMYRGANSFAVFGDLLVSSSSFARTHGRKRRKPNQHCEKNTGWITRIQAEYYHKCNGRFWFSFGFLRTFQPRFQRRPETREILANIFDFQDLRKFEVREKFLRMKGRGSEERLQIRRRSRQNWTEKYAKSMPICAPGAPRAYYIVFSWFLAWDIHIQI